MERRTEIVRSTCVYRYYYRGIAFDHVQYPGTDGLVSECGKTRFFPSGIDHYDDRIFDGGL